MTPLRSLLPSLLLTLALAGCAAPAEEYNSFIRSADARDGVYSFSVPLTDSLATYDFSFYGRLFSGRQSNVELRVLWLSPSGESFSETVYMRGLDSRGGEELYRSGVRLSEAGEWKVNVRPVGVGSEFAGLGLICTKEADGTR